MRVLLIALALPGGAGGALAGPVPSDGGHIARTELSATAAEPQHVRGVAATGPSTTTQAPATGSLRLDVPEETRIQLAQARAASLSSTSAEALEAAVSASPFDLPSRAQLVAYYFAHGSDSLELRRRRRDHVLWLIRNRPDSDAACNTYTLMWDYSDGKDTVAAVKTEWMRQVEGHPGSTVILDRAADAMFTTDKALGLSWLAKAERIEPKNPHWPERIGFRNYLDAVHESDSGAQYAAASRALAAYERAMALTPMRQDRLSFLDEAAFSAYYVKRDDKAERFAGERLKHTEVASWDNGNAVNHANTVLGLVALRRGDLAGAKDFLGKAGDVRGSPQLNSFGPDFRLARALLEKGERDAVADYLEACAEFWTSGKDRLARWRKEVAAGRTPDFNQYK